MVNRRNWVVVLVVAILALSLSGCMAAAVTVPDRPLTVDVNTALAAQQKAMSGQLSWTESEFSSLLSVLLAQNTGDNNPVTGINVWFEPNNEVIVRVNLKDGVMPAALGTSLDLAGKVSIMDGHLNIALDQAGAGSMSVSGAMLAPISAQINSALSGMMLPPLNVHTESGMLSIGM